MSLAGSTPVLENTVVRSADLRRDLNSSALSRSPSPSFAFSTPYIFQQVGQTSPLLARDATTQCLNYICPVRLVIDEEEADYYITSSTDTADQNAPSDNGHHETLLTLFSQPVDGQSSPTRYLRCSRTQLEDFTAWFSEQQHNPIRVPSFQSRLNVESIQTLTGQEKTLCQNQLVSVFRPWPQSQRRVAWMTLYCAANSIVDLGRPELIAAVEIGMQITSQTAEFIRENEQFASLVERSINSLSQIMLLRSSGEMVFRNALMKNFIRQLDIPDIRAGHSTMTRICFQQIRQWGAALMIQPWYNFRKWLQSLSEWPLIRYVVRNWFLHYRMTYDCDDINSEFYQLLKEALLVQMPKTRSILLESRIVDAGYDLSQIYHLPELEAVSRNMGAQTASTTNSVLGRIPTEFQWSRMKLVGLLTPPLDYQRWMSSHSAEDERKVKMIEDSTTDTVLVELENLHLSPDATFDGAKEVELSRATSPPLAGTCSEVFDVDETSSECEWVKVARKDTEMMDEA